MQTAVPERVVRILVLDRDAVGVDPMPGVLGVRLAVLDQLDLIGGEPTKMAVYDREPRPELEQRIRSLTGSGQVDYVVVRNNLGAGEALAAAVSEHLRERRACVVWNVYRPGDEAPYAALGYRDFVSGAFLPLHIHEVLLREFGALPKPGADKEECEKVCRSLHKVVAELWPPCLRDAG